MWNIQLTKADKRRCRELIHIGLEREENGFSVEGPWHKRYIALYKKTREYDKHVADRYDDITGGHYIDCVLGLYLDGIITDEEIVPLRQSTCSQAGNVLFPVWEQFIPTVGIIWPLLDNGYEAIICQDDGLISQ